MSENRTPKPPQESEGRIKNLEQALTTLTQGTIRNFEIVLDSIKRLENIALAHEQRLDDIEGHN